ncbi:hypothetical protein CGCF413_v007236 [Colletotrichum fructicola]|nr:hypothetical protein CGCF413_v007236 [Colletotrichum fructicola]
MPSPIPFSSNPHKPPLHVTANTGRWSKCNNFPFPSTIPASAVTAPLMVDGDGSFRVGDNDGSTGSGSPPELLFPTADAADLLGDWAEPFNIADVNVSGSPCSVGGLTAEKLQNNVYNERLVLSSWQDRETHAPLEGELYDDSSLTLSSESRRDSHSHDVKRNPPTALTSIIERLELCSQNSRSTLDQIVSANRWAMTRLPSIMAMDGFHRCHSCSALVTTVLDLILCMYKSAFESIQPDTRDSDHFATEQPDGPSRTQSHGSPARSALASSDADRQDGQQPRFYFGCVELDPDDQIMLRYMILKRDLLKCVELIQSCHESRKRLKQTSGSRSEDGHGLRDQEKVASKERNDSQEWWYEEMQKRASELLACLDSKGGKYAK